LTDEELEEEKLREMETVIQREADKREERERVAAEEALMKARRQEEWVRCPATPRLYDATGLSPIYGCWRWRACVNPFAQKLVTRMRS